MKKFDIPTYYRSSFIANIKEQRKLTDQRKKDFSPTKLDFGPVTFFLARHFGFCYGVENAIEISYRALEENPGKRIFLLSQMIHNPEVNNDLRNRGIDFIMDTQGNQFIKWEEISAEDIVIIPAFGTTIEIENKLRNVGVQVERYNTTCPFVEKVWKMSAKLGANEYSVIIHGKEQHEETRATFSHSKENAPSLVIRDIVEAEILGKIIKGEINKDEFYKTFEGRHNKFFDVEKDLQRLGVVNQTTMLASETQEISEYLKQIMIDVYGEASYKDHFADTRDTLCYATNDNQEATYGLLKEDADIAIVVGGYNSSNTSHIVELCEHKLPTYFISSVEEIESKDVIHHFNFRTKEKLTTSDYLPKGEATRIFLTSGASCPDTVVEQVLDKILNFYTSTRSKEELISELSSAAHE